jgi:hypothetical protein
MLIAGDGMMSRIGRPRGLARGLAMVGITLAVSCAASREASAQALPATISCAQAAVAISSVGRVEPRVQP